MAEKRKTRLRICELNPHLLCALCGGYLIDATTIVECLHSFCKTCILRYLETSNYCPICEVLIHKKRPWQNIRLDHTLQNAVYKLVPGLFKREMQRRREFYEKNPPPGDKETEQVHVAPERIIFSEDEKFSVSLEFSPNGRAVQVENEKSVTTPHRDKRFLLCPANVCIGHLKKFVRLKNTLPDCCQIDLFYSDEPLDDTYTLMDVAYIYSWRRENVLTLYYSFYQRPRKRRRVTASATATSQDRDTTSATSVIKAKAGSTSTSSTSSAAASTSTTTSTVTIVEASDGGSVTEAEGTKTTVSVSMPAPVSLPLSLPLPLPLLATGSVNSQSISQVEFDDIDDDDDDERPLIIVTDTASATLMDVDMAEGESGVTIISHPKTLSSKGSSGSSGADGTDDVAAKVPSTSDTDVRECQATSQPSSINNLSVISSAPLPTCVTNIPATGGSSCGTACVVTASSSSALESSSATETLHSSTASPSGDIVCSKECPNLEKRPVISVSTGAVGPGFPVAQNSCSSGLERRTNISNQTRQSPRPQEHLVSKQPSEISSSSGSSCPSESAQPVTNSVRTVQTSRPCHSLCPAEQTQPADNAGPTGAACSAELAPSAGTLSVTEPVHPANPPSAEKSTLSADHSVRPAEPTSSADRLHQTESSCSGEVVRAAESSGSSEPSLPSHSPRSKEVSALSERPRCSEVSSSESSRAKEPTPSQCPAKAPLPSESPRETEHCTESTETSLPSETALSKEAARPKEASCPAQISCSASGSNKGPNISQRESNKKEVRPASSTKVPPRDVSSTGSNRSRSSSSSMGIFERIYTVTSNCTESGIKSIFKTTAIVPAAASRRYSDVSGISPAAGLGERRASTGGGGTSIKGLAGKDKSKATASKQKASPQRDNRSSMDALAHLTKNSLFTSPQSNKTLPHKVLHPNVDAATGGVSTSAGSVSSSSSDKRSNANSISGSFNSDKRTSASASSECNNLERNQVGVSSAERTPEKRPDTNARSVCNDKAVGGSCGSTKQKSSCSSAGRVSSTHSNKSPSQSTTTDNKQSPKVVTAVITGDLRVKLPKCTIPEECLTATVGQTKHQQRSGTGSLGSGKGIDSKAAVTALVSSASTVNKLKSANAGKPLSTSGTKLCEEDKKVTAMIASADKPSTDSVVSPKHQAGLSDNQRGSAVKKEAHGSDVSEKRQLTASLVSKSVATSTSSSVTSVVNSKTSSAADKEKGVVPAASDTSSHGPNKAAALVVSNISTKADMKIGSVKAEGGVSSTAGVKRPHSAISATNSNSSSAQRVAITSTTTPRLQTGNKLVTITSGLAKSTAVSSSHIRVPSVSGVTGPEAKKPKLSGSSQFTMSPLITPTILSSSSAATSCHPAYRAGTVPGVRGTATTSPSGTVVSSSKTVLSGNLRSGGGASRIRPQGNHAMSSSKLLPPGQRVDSLLFRATNRLAAAASAARPITSNNVAAASLGQKKVRSESVDSRMSFINKTFGGGKSSKETCVNPAASRSEISFSARHILSPAFHSHSSAVSRSSGSTVASSKSSSSTSISSAKGTAGACDLTRKSSGSVSSKDGKGGKEVCASDGSSRSAADSIKLDIPRLSTSSRDSVFTSDPESSPTPSPKYSDINRNPIKLEPGSKLCRKETWVSAENGGRRSTGSVGSPNSLGSGPGSPLETERSPARDARRPSDSELLLSQRWHGLPPHPHLLTLPHARDPATAVAVAAAAAALYNGHFKVPSAAKFLPLPPDHVPRPSSPDPMPLDYSTSSSSTSSK